MFYVALKTKHLNQIQTFFPGFRLSKENDFGGCVPVPPADGCTYQQDIKASEKIMSFFVSIGFYFRFEQLSQNLLENFRGLTPEKLCSHPHTKEVVVGFEERRPKALQAPFSMTAVVDVTFEPVGFFFSELFAQPLLALLAEQKFHAIFVFE